MLQRATVWYSASSIKYCARISPEFYKIDILHFFNTFLLHVCAWKVLVVNANTCSKLSCNVEIGQIDITYIKIWYFHIHYYSQCCPLFINDRIISRPISRCWPSLSKRHACPPPVIHIPLHVPVDINNNMAINQTYSRCVYMDNLIPGGNEAKCDDVFT